MKTVFKMKPSKYNYIFHTNNGSYWMNGITKSTLKFTTVLGKKIESHLSEPHLIHESSPKLYNLLSEGGFIIDKSTDEINKIRELYNVAVNRKDYFLIVMPTLNCNLKCHYCVQSHIPSCMSSDTMESVKKHIQFMITHEGITSLHLEWFGGEPFMYFDDVINPITQFAKEMCESAKIPFFASATTNGVLINNKIAIKLPEISFRHFQISLDGDKKLHDSIKFNESLDSAFDTTLNNIVNIIQANNDTKITLRINYTAETLKTNIIQEVCERIPVEVRSNITIVLKKVWQHNVDLTRFDTYINLLKEFHNHGFKVNMLDITQNFLPCYVNKKYYTCINYNGHLLKCTNTDELYSEDPIGAINEDGSLSWKNNFDLKNQEPPFENENCLKCIRLPICMGHCPRNHMQSTEWSCKWTALDIDLKKAIIAQIDHELNCS